MYRGLAERGFADSGVEAGGRGSPSEAPGVRWRRGAPVVEAGGIGFGGL